MDIRIILKCDYNETILEKLVCLKLRVMQFVFCFLSYIVNYTAVNCFQTYKCEMETVLKLIVLVNETSQRGEII